MGNSLEKKVIKTLKETTKFILSRQFIPVLKGTLSYVLAFILIFLRGFDDLSRYPLAYSGMMLVVIAGGAGKSVGACIQSAALAMSGVALGSVGFLVLAKLSHWPVAQAVVFAVIVYAMALVKARGIRWFGFSLLCILNSFNGVYTSYLLGGVFNPTYLEEYLVSYLWGTVIVLGVNLLVFPTSSERELRGTLVASLEHVGTFAHLLAKGYTLEINEEERAVRERLSQTIRADFGFLSQKIEETTIEINFSRFSLKDYQCFVARTRSLQQALITAHSSLIGMEGQDVELFKQRFLPDTIGAFSRLRRSVDLTIRDIGNQLGCRPMVIPSTEAKYNEYMDLESRGASYEASLSATASGELHTPPEELDDQLTIVSERLAAEVADSDIRPSPQAGTSDRFKHRTAQSTEKALEDGEASCEAADACTPAFPTTTAGTPDGKEQSTTHPIIEGGIQRLRQEFDAYSVAQHDIIKEVLINGHLKGADDGQLRLHQLRPSLRDTYGLDYVAGDVEGDMPPEQLTRRRGGADEEESRLSTERRDARSCQTAEGEEQVLMDGHSLIRVWSFLFALGQFVSELEALSASVRPAGVQPKKRIHVHVFEALHRPHKKVNDEDEDGNLSLKEALALLEKKPYTPVKSNVWQRLGRIQDVIQSPTSLFAAKTAVAASVFGTLVYASAPRGWFINYALSSGMLTIVVALAPTLGQSMVTFVLQIAGSGIGYLWGLAVLEMFRGVGGYTFNPYGITCMIIPYALIMVYVLYNKPQYFVVALLGMNGTGVLVATEWVAVEALHRSNFDSPALRTGKALSALMIALAIVAIFQLFIYRNPARRTLRKKLAELTFETLSYAVLLQAFGRSVLSSDPKHRPSKPALKRVERELRHRELKLQSANINLLPLIRFAAAEPQFSRPFRKDVTMLFVRSNQLVLDRLREARAALGTQQFQEFILSHFVSVLAPYRALNTRTVKAQLYLIASSLQSKAPLPHDTPMRMLTDSDRADFIHDTLVLSAQFAQTDEGKMSIRSREFMRYVSYLLCSSATGEPLRVMEDASKQLFGELESKLM